jgi:putative ABC transport system permease protein
MLKSYFKIAWRTIARHKSYTAINVAGLSVGVACALLIFLLVRFQLSFDAYHTHADRIYRVVTAFHFDQVYHSPGVPRPIADALRNDLEGLEAVALEDMLHEALISIDATENKESKKFKEDQVVAFVEPAYFEIFDFTWLTGNPQTSLKEPYTAIITEKYALKYFNDPNPIGRTFRLDNFMEFKVTGVIADYPENTDLKQEVYLSYSSFKTYADRLKIDVSNWGSITSGTNCFILLKEGRTAEALQGEIAPFKAKYLKKDASTYDYKLQPLSDIHFNGNYQGSQKSTVWVLVLIGIFIISIACINFINLATAQAIKRSKEVGIRKVMGSNRTNIFWQFMLETGTITLCAIVLSLFLAELALPYVNELFDVKLRLSLVGDAGLLLALPVLLLIITMFAGAYPGLIISGFNPVHALKGSISARQVGGMPVRRSLVVLQFAISQVLIIGTIVVLSQLQYFKQADLGFKKDAVLMLPVPQQDVNKLHSMRENLLTVTGIESVSYSFTPPFSGTNNTTDFVFDNRDKSELYQIVTRQADTHYLDLYGLELAAGRNLQASDTIREYLVNETFASTMGLTPGEVIGKTLKVHGKTAPIVGVVRDFHTRSFDTEIRPLCMMSDARNYITCNVKVNLSDVKDKIATMDKVWSATFPDHVFEYRFLDAYIAEYYETEETMLKTIRAFSVIAILISCLGLYGLVSYMAEQKTKEVGIRKVLGASAASILLLFSKEFARLVLAAFLVAAPLGWWGMDKWLQNYAYRVSLDPWMFIVTIGIAVSIALLTISAKALKAAIANPVKALRNE